MDYSEDKLMKEFTLLFSVYIFSLNVCGEQKTFIYKKFRSL